MANSQVTTRDTQLEKQRIGFLQLTLTNFASTSEPAIAAGSVVEVGGSLYVFSGDEAITGWGAIGNDTDCYIRLPYNGALTAEFTTVAPTWSASKQGWYDGIKRYVAGLHRGAGAGDYEDKWIYQKSQDKTDDHRFLGTGVVEFDSGIAGDLTGGIVETGAGSEVLRSAVIEIGDWNMNTTPNITVTITPASYSNIMSIEVMIRNDNDSLGGDTYKYPFLGDDGTFWRIREDVPTLLELHRAPAGLFDTADFQNTGWNRGWITIWYAS